MSQRYPSALLENVMDRLASLPGVRRETALRLTLYMLRWDVDYTENLVATLVALCRDVKYRRVRHNIYDNEVCPIYVNPSHDHPLICVAKNIREVMAIENTGQLRGVHRVLDRITSPMDGIGSGDLYVDSLAWRVAEDEVEEIILALSTTMEGDTINFLIYRKLSGYDVGISTVARGVPIGDEIEYADEITLG